MRGAKAKKLRRIAYGDMSLKSPRKYIENHSTIQNHPQSNRWIYQALKRQVKQ